MILYYSPYCWGHFVATPNTCILVGGLHKSNYRPSFYGKQLENIKWYLSWYYLSIESIHYIYKITFKLLSSRKMTAHWVYHACLFQFHTPFWHRIRSSFTDTKVHFVPNKDFADVSSVHVVWHYLLQLIKNLHIIHNYKEMLITLACFMSIPPRPQCLGQIAWRLLLGWY